MLQAVLMNEQLRKPETILRLKSVVFMQLLIQTIR